MIYRSKADSFYKKLIFIVILFVGAVTLIPLFFDEVDLTATTILIATFLLIIGFIFWIMIDIRYVFYEDYLLVKGGPFTSRIRYEKITKVAPTIEVLSGFRILTAKDALQIFYDGSLLGSVKISPADKKGFLIELQKRCPNLK